MEGSVGDNADVHDERPVTQVEMIEPDPMANLQFRVGFTAATFHLSQSGNAGFGEVTDAVVIDESAEVDIVVHEMGTRTDHAHLSFEHVEELRNLIETGFPEEVSAREDAGITFLSLKAGRVVQMHGAKFVDFEDLAIPTSALLTIEQGAR